MNEPNTWMGTETGGWPNNYGLPHGSASQRNEIDDHSQKADRGGRIENLINQPLPWVCLFALVLIAYIWIDMDRRADMRVQLIEAQLSAQAANQRISDNIAAQAMMQSAIEQSMNDHRNRSIDAETQALLLREHYDKIANDFAAHGYLLPMLPKELKPAK